MAATKSYGGVRPSNSRSNDLKPNNSKSNNSKFNSSKASSLELQDRKDRRLAAVTAGVLMTALLIFVPLYLENAYFNVVEAKSHALSVVAIAFWLVMLVGVIVARDGRFLVIKKLTLGDMAILGGALAALVSTVLSGQVKAAFLGSDGWGIGGFVLISFAGMYLFLSRCHSGDDNWHLVPLAVSDLIFLIGLLHAAGYDFLRLHEGIAPNQFYTYASTLGNINVHVGYLCLTIPLLLVWYLREDKPIKRLFLLFSLEMALSDSIVCASDGIFVGLGFCAFFFVPFLVSDKIYLKALSPVLGVFGVILLALQMMPAMAQKRETIEGLSALFLKRPVAVLLILVGVCLWFLCRYKEKWLTDRVLKVFGFVLEMVLISAFLYFAADLLFHFSDDWGTKRGLIWRTSFDEFHGLSLKDKLFGVGPERQALLYEGLKVHGLRVKVSHSEPIQMLLSMGMAGLGVWLLFWGSTLALFFRKTLWKQRSFMYFLPLAAYFAQSFVNSAMAVNVAVLCVTAALFRRFLND